MTVRRDQLEQTIFEAWTELLELERIDPDADFLASGGNSLIATMIASRVAELIGLRPPLVLMFDLSPARLVDACEAAARERPAEWSMDPCAGAC